MPLRTWGSAVARMATTALVAAGLAGVQAGAAPGAAAAEPAPAPLPQTVAADSLPTAQINGVVWDQVIVGNTVYVGGEFTRARPPGAAAGINETVRNNMLAYNLSTGQMISSFDPNLNGTVKDLAVTPDQSKLVAVGNFTQAGSQTRNRVAVFDIPSGQGGAGATLSTTVVPSVNGSTQSVAATNSTIYLGGYFSSVNGGLRIRIAAIRTSNGAVTDFYPSVEGDGAIVQSIVVAPDEQSVVISGSFTSVNGSSSPGYGLARIDAATSASLALPVNDRVRDAGASASILRLKSDGERFYGVGWHYGRGGNLEGFFAANWSDGSLFSIQDCHGDHYDLEPIGDVIYTSSHAHYCSNSDGFPQTSPGTNRHAGAWTADVRGTNKGDIYDYPDHPGTPRPEMLNFHPPFVAGTYTQAAQATWSVTGNDDYVLYGGEFLRASGQPQQGIARFATRSIAPNTRGPRLISTGWAPTVASYAPGSVRVQWQPNVDWDDEVIRYQVFRGSMNNMVHETTQKGQFFETSSMVFTDTDSSLAPGSTAQYRVRAVDPAGNVASSDWTSVTVASTANTDTYADSVLGDGATKYWRLDEKSGSQRHRPRRDGQPDRGHRRQPQRARRAARQLGHGQRLQRLEQRTGDLDPAVRRGGTVLGSAGVLRRGLGPYELERRRQVRSYGSSATGTSGTYDRDLYLDSSRRISFSLRGRTRVVLRTDAAYNDNQWHHVVGTYSAATGAHLYVDGRRVASNDTLPAVREFRGYWRVGGDGTASGAQYLNGQIDEFAVYDRVLTNVDVNEHWVASGRSSVLPNQAPSASFTAATRDLGVSLDAAESSDLDGTITSYAWDFGDASTAAGSTAQHTYTRAGTYTVTLTVVDDDGAAATSSQDVTVTEPVNQVPTAAFATAKNGLSVTLDGTSSTDADGTIASYTWDLGDGTSASGATPSHTYGQGGTYRVSLTVTDDRGGTASTSQDVTVAAPNAGLLADDPFDRTAAGGWGNAETGGPWTTTGPAARFSVENSAGQMRFAAGQTLESDLLDVDSSSTEVTSEFSLDKVATGTYVSVIGREVGSDRYYARLRVGSGGAAQLMLLQNFNSVASQVTVPGLSIVADRSYTMKVRVTGTSPTTVAAKVWPTDDAEPSDWQRTGTNSLASLQTRGHVGVFGFVPSSATNAPIQLSWHDLLATDPNAAVVNRAPTADFTSTRTGLTAAFDASGSSDPEDAIASYAWSFGDGATGIGVRPSHTYSVAGTYSVGLTVRDQEGATDTKTIPVTVTDPAADGLAADDFDREVTGGWGSAGLGGAWTLTGPASRFDVAGGSANLRTASGQSLYADLRSVSSQRTSVVTEFSVDKLAEGTYVAVAGRRLGADSYVARVRIAADGSARLYLLQNGNGLGSFYQLPFTVVPDQRYMLAFDVTGSAPTTLSAKVWRSSDPEPAAWQRTATNTYAALQGPGSLGVFSFLPGSASAFAPVTVSFHDLTAVRPPD